MAAPTEIDIRQAYLPAEIDPASARLPQAYEAAKQALATCERIDECQEWADKMAALASYARQVEDESLLNMAKRIHGRTLRRAGELLQQFNAPGTRTDRPTDGAVSRLTQREAAAAAGMSERQQVTAVRVANVPEPEFEAAIESEEPPTVTALAEAGKKPRELPDLLRGRDPVKFSAAIHTLGALRRLAEKCFEHPPEYVAGGVDANDVAEARKLVMEVDAWLISFFGKLEADGP